MNKTTIFNTETIIIKAVNKAPTSGKKIYLNDDSNFEPKNTGEGGY
jgi:hypothetical protein